MLSLLPLVEVRGRDELINVKDLNNNERIIGYEHAQKWWSIR